MLFVVIRRHYALANNLTLNGVLDFSVNIFAYVRVFLVVLVVASLLCFILVSIKPPFVVSLLFLREFLVHLNYRFH